MDLYLGPTDPCLQMRRLNLQHYLRKDGLGYLLHPSIPQPKANYRIANLGAGTGYGYILAVMVSCKTSISNGNHVESGY